MLCRCVGLCTCGCLAKPEGSNAEKSGRNIKSVANATRFCIIHVVAVFGREVAVFASNDMFFGTNIVIYA